MSHSTTDGISPPLPELRVVARTRVADQVVEILTDAILSGTYAAGSALPAERDLAEQLGVNRTSLRQALSRLEQLGLVESQQGRGTIVLDPTQNPDPTVLSGLVSHLGPELLAEIMEVREGVAGIVGKLAAERATTADIAALRDATDAVRASPNAAACQRAELAWFSSLVDATRNRALILLVRWVWAAYGGAAASFESAFANPRRIARELAQVTNAVANHEVGEATSALMSYARASGRRLVKAARQSVQGS
ncbi:MAG: GntR family transcriptional regulator [Acidimicrobiales bacterium]|nr:GntR family transcriptional regulator [Acidimicrobiales bacterium]